MMKILKMMSVATATIVMELSLVSCEDSLPENYVKENGLVVNKNTTAMVVIIGNHANAMKVPKDVYSKLEDELDNVVYGGYVSVIIADSTPTKIEVKEKDFFKSDAKQSYALENMINTRKSKLKKAIQEIAETPADSEEVDLLEALREAKSDLASADAVNKKIIFIDPGISTSGDLNMCQFTFDPDPEKRIKTDNIIENLTNYEGKNVLPDLSGIDVIFYGKNNCLAEPAGEQIMETVDKQYVKELWEKVVNKCHAKSVDFVEISGWDTPIIEGGEIPHVSVTHFAHIFSPSSDNSLEGGLPTPPKPIVSLSNSEIGFKPDTAEFISDISEENFVVQYKEVAIAIKHYLEYNPGKKVYIAGSTAKYGDGDGYSLSYDRAEVIKNLLCNGSFENENGESIKIDKEKISVIGLGNTFPWKINEYENGTFIEEKAKENRRVYIFTEISEEDTDVPIDYYKELSTASKNGTLLLDTVSDINKAFGLQD